MATANLSVFLRRLTRGMAAETLTDQSDRQLVEQFLARREEAAFEALLRRHGPMVYRVCWRVLQRVQDAEDAFQATFLVLAQKLSTVRKYDSLASWLHGVAHRTALVATGHSIFCLSSSVTWKGARKTKPPGSWAAARTRCEDGWTRPGQRWLAD